MGEGSVGNDFDCAAGVAGIEVADQVGEFGGEFVGQAGRYHSFYWGHARGVGE